MNKRGEVKAGTIVLVVVALLVVGIATGYIDLSKFGKSTPAPPQNGGTGICPDTQLSNVYINTLKALTTTPTSATATAYVYDGGTKFVATGTTSSTSSAISLACGKTYKAIVLNETAGVGNGYYSTTQDIITDQATKTYNLELYQYGSVRIINIKNPVDPAGLNNISASIGAVKDFTIQLSENYTQTAFNKPIILCQVNTTSVTQLTLGGETTPVVSLPKRVSASTGYQYYGFVINRMYKSTDALLEVPGKITFSSSIAPSASDSMTCKVVDQATYRKSNYQLVDLSTAFTEGAENVESLADVGGPDSATASLYFVNGGGY